MNMMKYVQAGGMIVALVFSFAFSQPTHAADNTFMPGTWMFSGVVTEVNPNKIELFGMNANGMEVWPKFSITSDTQVKNGVLLFNASNDVRWNVTNEIQRGSSVTIWATTSGKAMVIKNNAPWGQADYYGQVDCSHCGN